MNNKILILLALIGMLAGCKKITDPAMENNRQLDSTTYLANDARFPFGILLNGYTRIPTNGWSFNDVATDDAVSNDQSNAYLKMATGQWTANNNPLNQWTNSYAAIKYINIMLGEADKVTWAADSTANRLFRTRITGEAYGLRGLFMYHLLQTHAGVAESGGLLGVPIITEPEGTSTDFNKPRATFEECMKQIYSDLDKAVELLPVDYNDIPAGQEAMIPSKYGTITRVEYNRVFGLSFRGFLTARVAMAIKAQAALLAASPAYSSGNTTTWADAARYAGAVLKLNPNGLAAGGLNWYANSTEIAGLADGANPAEILWRNNYGDNRDLEQANYPPTLFGSGRINPTQNLVDAFPMANGYPVSDPAGAYSATAPYTNRDPRLKLFILVNGATAGASSTVINTAADGTTNDAINKVETSTRTGYYLRKLLRQDVNLNPSSASNQRHYKPHIRYTEIYLLYAEAANEAGGPGFAGENNLSAYDVIKAIRKRAGVGTTNGDPYLESARASKETMRTLIRNERRLELCFEGFRFWDLRRWNANLNEQAKGISIKGGIYTTIPVQDRIFQSFMNYGPVPYSEILKFNALQQNKGWR